MYSRLVAATASLPHDRDGVVDDGSCDGSAQILGKFAPHDPRVCVVHLSRNFSHQPASTTAVRFSSGGAVVLMDGDLQDPPDLVRE